MQTLTWVPGVGAVSPDWSSTSERMRIGSPPGGAGLVSTVRVRLSMRAAKGISKKLFEAIDLIALPDCDEIVGHGSLGTRHHGPGVSGDHQHAAEHIGRVFHLKGAAQDLEGGMTAEQIVLPSVVQQAPADAGMLAAADILVVEADLLGKSPGL